ncbi:MAG: hypothetical protein OXF51_08175, partial [Alphaproteobacteria bacterium]|nr:hypothetical protein [Alphaproteobacteria bacterium]
KDAHLVEATLRRGDRSFVTDHALKAECAVIAMMKAGIGEGAALARESAVATHLADAGLTEGQADAVRRILLTPDRIVGVQGRQRQDDDAGPCPRTCGRAAGHGPSALDRYSAGAGARDRHGDRHPAMVPRPQPVRGGPTREYESRKQKTHRCMRNLGASCRP